MAASRCRLRGHGVVAIRPLVEPASRVGGEPSHRQQSKPPAACDRAPVHGFIIRADVTLNVTPVEISENFVPIGQGDVVELTSIVPAGGDGSGPSRSPEPLPGAVAAGSTTVTPLMSVPERSGARAGIEPAPAAPTTTADLLHGAGTIRSTPLHLLMLSGAPWSIAVQGPARVTFRIDDARVCV
ncbi:MAG: hypothetical protein ACRDYB_02585 [Acidimicrobiales bacterium]